MVALPFTYLYYTISNVDFFIFISSIWLEIPIGMDIKKFIDIENRL